MELHRSERKVDHTGGAKAANRLEQTQLKLKAYLAKHHIRIVYDPIFTIILIGLSGMFVAIGLFAIGKQPYGEIILENKVPLIKTLLFERRDQLQQTVKSLVHDKDTIFPNSSKPDKEIAAMQSKAEEQIVRAKNAIKSTEKELTLLDKANIDTNLLYFTQYIFVNRSIYLAALKCKDRKTDHGFQTQSIEVILMDTCRAALTYPITCKGMLQLKVNNRGTKIDFFTDYPLFGLWLIFSVAQMVLWFMTPPLLYSGLSSLKERIEIAVEIDSVNLVFNSVCALLLTLLFMYVFYMVIIDKPIISDGFFLEYYRPRIYIYAILGYTAASFCFGVFVTVAKETERASEKAGTSLRKDDDTLNKKYLALSDIFQRSFTCSALILSFCVLWTGILVHAVNGTEGFRFYNYLSGKNVIPEDFVFLLGLMNTLLLLIYYVPVKLKFSSLPISQEESKSLSLTTLFDILSKNIGPILITASPLLASFIQSLFTIMVK